MVGFEELATGHDHLALVFGDISGEAPVLARVHSECLTGDALFSLRCDCGFQLEAALEQIAEEAAAFCFIIAEGRNIGLLNKIPRLCPAGWGADTVGSQPPARLRRRRARLYPVRRHVQTAGRRRAVRLLTNNPKKVEI
ncbi:hypothetical protein M8494_08625 [Serratia ureilytica]